MSDLFQVDGVDFVEKLEEKSINKNNNISLIDIFESYIEVAQQSVNAVTPELLRSLVFKQFQSYGDFDEQVRETAQTVSDITDTTGDVISAIEKDDKEDIKMAFNKLKVYKNRMSEMEDGLYLDEQTQALNRKYLFVKKLNEKLTFKNDGVLFLLHIEGAEELEELYGSIVVKSVMKKFVKMSNQALEPCETPLIKYENNAFLVMTDSENQNRVHSILQALHRTFEVKKFKLVGEKTLSFNFSSTEKAFKKDMPFEAFYKNFV